MNENRGRNKLTGNLVLKAIALAMGFLIWLMVTNSDDPTRSLVLSNVPINIINEDSIADIGKVVEPEGSGTVTLKVTERRSVLNRLARNGSDFYVEADLENINEMNTVPLTVICTNPNVTWDEVSIKPSSLKVKLEDKMEQAFVVSVAASGNVAQGHAVGNTEVLDGKTILIAGPESLISIINQVTAPVDVAGMSKDGTVVSTLRVTDRNGNDLTEAQLSLLEFKDSNGNLLQDRHVSVLVRLWDLKQDVKLQVLTEGKVAEGYRVGSVSTVPQTISLVGEADALEELGNRLEVLDKVNVEGASELVSVEIDLTPTLAEYENIRLPADTDPIINVDVDIRKRGSLSMKVPLSDIKTVNRPENMKLVFTPADEISFTVYSSSEEAVTLSAEEIGVSLDLGVCAEEGNYEIPVDITLPEGFELGDEVKVTVSATPVADAEAAARAESSREEQSAGAVTQTESETGSGEEEQEERGSLLSDVLKLGPMTPDEEEADQK